LGAGSTACIEQSCVVDADAHFNETIHAPLRLRICGLLRSVNEINFSVLRDTLGVSDANLSKHLKVLTDVGFVKTTKSASPTRNDSRRVTWVKLTASGRKAFDAHIEELRIITAGSTAGSARPQEEPG
jgi:DNA-binding MarR family transcriptional regulator